MLLPHHAPRAGRLDVDPEDLVDPGLLGGGGGPRACDAPAAPAQASAKSHQRLSSRETGVSRRLIRRLAARPERASADGERRRSLGARFGSVAPPCENAPVAKASKEPAPPRLDIGWRELQEGRWEEARALFEEAVGAAESEAFEGLSWAAWWLDDAEAVFDARESAYRLYREAGDVARAARMATWLACDQLDFHGAVAVASGWLARAHRLLDPLEPGPEHGWLAFLEGYMALRAARPRRRQNSGAARLSLGGASPSPTGDAWPRCRGRR